jgi:hypothetical protein
LLTFDFQNNDSFDCALPNLTIANLGWILTAEKEFAEPLFNEIWGEERVSLKPGMEWNMNGICCCAVRCAPTSRLKVC